MTKCVIAFLTALLVVTPSQFSHASKTSSAKAYAVFVASYNAQGAVGGVAGTAFFTSSTQAITAYHVLQPTSFKPLPGYDRAKVWLVHEGEPAIELNASNTTFNASQDETKIELQTPIKLEYVYSVSNVPLSLVGGQVETEGFIAGSTGPELEKTGDELRVASVPHLERMRLTGAVDRKVFVSIEALDIKLKNVNCLQLSYKPIVGFSGGPVIYNGHAIGMNSFAEPQTRTTTFAIPLSSTGT